MKMETLAVHGGHAVDASSGAVTPPIHLSTTYACEPGSECPPDEYTYSRTDNPNRRGLEELLTLLEGGEAAAVFASGTAAIMAVVQSLQPGDHLIAPLDGYRGTAVLLAEFFESWGGTVTYVDMSEPGAVAGAVRPETKMVWVETPSNPLLRLTDIACVAEIAHTAGALCVCDNTVATPVLQQPLLLGADLVVHSVTKYLSGHGDVVAGAVVARRADALFDRVRRVQEHGGAIPSPFECWLALRGLRTLPYRMRAHAGSALQIARFLDDHAAVRRVHYPGLPCHPGHPIAARQMEAFGGMVSFNVHGGADEALAVARGLRLFTHATSLGGPESLVEYRPTVQCAEPGAYDHLLRLSIGLEHPEDLIADLSVALAAGTAGHHRNGTSASAAVPAPTAGGLEAVR